MLAKNPDAAGVPTGADDWLKERLQAIEASRDDLDKQDVEYAVMLLGQAMGMSAFVNKKVGRFFRRNGGTAATSPALAFIFDVLIDSAFQGDALADHLLCRAAQRFIDNREPLPKPLGDYACKVWRGKGPGLERGRHNTRTWDRDRHIVTTVCGLIARGCTQERAHWATSLALKRFNRFMSEGAVRQVWRRRKQQYRPVSLPDHRAADPETAVVDAETAQHVARLSLSNWLLYA